MKYLSANKLSTDAYVCNIIQLTFSCSIRRFSRTVCEDFDGAQDARGFAFDVMSGCLIEFLK